MDDLGKKDVDMEVLAYLQIENSGSGAFQFVLVSGSICGDFENSSEGTTFDFTWEGNDECDPVSGDGWLKTTDGKTGAGQIRLHGGDKYGFLAKRVNYS